MRAQVQSVPQKAGRHEIMHYRFDPVMHLEDGGSLGSRCEMSSDFEERVSFGPASLLEEAADPAVWLSERLTDIAGLAHEFGAGNRPILVPAPVAALQHANTPIACDAAIRRTTLCQQEICLEFPDAALASDPEESVRRVAQFRRRGFRVAIDMRRTWQTPLHDSLRLMIDTIHINAEAWHKNEDLREVCDEAACSGILIVADQAAWRDGEWFVKNGVSGTVRPRSDA